jgi:DNA polymerase III delta' subunit
MLALKRRLIVSCHAVKAAFERGKLPHALLFLGPSGAGQVKAAKDLAKTMFCRERKANDACGKCFSCRQVEAGNHPDLHIIEPLEESRAVKVEQVREMIQKANLKPFQADSKFFIVDHAEALNEVSQNALLKTLEEPPPRTHIVLIAYAAEKIISTVRSRAQEFRFSGDEGAQELETHDEAERSVLDYILGRGPAPDMAGMPRDEVLRSLENVVRDLRSALVMGTGALPGNGRPGVASISESLERGTLIDKIEKLAQFKEKVQQNVNTKLALTVLWDEI